jgi:tetratricopeptide (TPR) repeat protein
VLTALVLGACASALDRGEELYRQGDVRGALEVWSQVPEDSREHERVQARLRIVQSEYARMLRRYEKRAAFFESEGRLAEAVLYYRLAYKMDPARGDLLSHVQVLVRKLRKRGQTEASGLRAALDAGDLRQASRHAQLLAALDPFDPAVQLEIRQVRAAAGARVLNHIAEGESAYGAGDRAGARKAFDQVLELDPRNETAHGYLSYIARFEAYEAEQAMPPPPRSISQEEILAEGHFRSASEAERAGEDFWAITEYEAALSVEPNHQGARKALTTLRTRLLPQVDELYQIGKRYFQDEDLHNALRAWRRALSIDPTDERTRENVERAERMLARLEELQTGESPGS